jgi:hypothetical protein
MGGAYNTNDSRNACSILVRKPEGKRQLGRNRRRWEENIRLNLREIGWGKCGLGFISFRIGTSGGIL